MRSREPVDEKMEAALTCLQVILKRLEARGDLIGEIIPQEGESVHFPSLYSSYVAKEKRERERNKGLPS